MACASWIPKDTGFRTLLECQLCLDEITDPKALPCLHTFCMICIDTLAKGSFQRRVSCPLCCKVWEIPRQGAAGLPTNFLINTLRDMTEAQNDGTDPKGDFGENPFSCERHRMPLELFCRNDRALICYACYAHDHPGHVFILVEQAAALCSEEIYFGMRQHLLTLQTMHRNTRPGRISNDGRDDDLAMSQAIVESTMTQLIELGGNEHPVQNIRFCLRVRDQGLPMPPKREQDRHMGNCEVHCGEIMGSMIPYEIVTTAAEPAAVIETRDRTTQKQDDIDIGKRMKDILQTSVNRLTTAFEKLFSPHVKVSASRLNGRGFINDLAFVGSRGLVAVRPGRLEFYRNRNLIKAVTGDFRCVATTADLSIAATNNSNKIEVFSPAGVPLRDMEFPMFLKICGIARSDNHLILLDSGTETLAVIDHRTRQIIRQSKITAFGNPRYISVDKGGQNTVISDSTENSITVLDADSTVVMKCGDNANSDVKLQSPRSVCFLENGSLVVADCWNHRVIAINSNGQSVDCDIITKDHGLHYPHAVAVDDNGSILIGDEEGQLFDVQLK